MPTWAWIVIAVIAVVFVVVVAAVGFSRRRTQKLRGAFGPEYDRTVESTGDRKEAEAELRARHERHEQLELRPLSAAARERYLEQWQSVQAQFVDDPRGAVRVADTLIQSAMAERGYPVDDFDQRAADISVDHPDVVAHYRTGRRLSETSERDDATEDLRQAMQHYRMLFEELISPVEDHALTRDDATALTDGHVAR